MRTFLTALTTLVAGIFGFFAPTAATQTADHPFLESEFIFPLEHWHNHASMIVELPGGDLLVCWFYGSGERTADDVVVRGARLRKGSHTGSEPFLLADTPGYPDTNATMFVDPKERLWLLWPTILANEWHTALMKYKISSSYGGDGAPRWDVSEVLQRPGARSVQPGGVVVGRRGADVAPDAASGTGRDLSRRAAAWSVSLSVHHPGGGRHAARNVQLLRTVRLRDAGRRRTSSAQDHQARPL
jgi:hypothetical protein